MRIPLLISGIFNCIVAISWAFGCVTAIISVPLLVLAVYEFMTYARLGRPGFIEMRDRVKVLQILEICTIIVGNAGSLVCGILGLVFAAQEREKGTF